MSKGMAIAWSVAVTSPGVIEEEDTDWIVRTLFESLSFW
jgi:hypothetical protein